MMLEGAYMKKNRMAVKYIPIPSSLVFAILFENWLVGISFSRSSTNSSGTVKHSNGSSVNCAYPSLSFLQLSSMAVHSRNSNFVSVKLLLPTGS